MAKYKKGYLSGSFDLFHVGHLNIIRKAANECDSLVVGVNSDAVIMEKKHKTPIINEVDRAEIIGALRYVDDVFIQTDYNDRITPMIEYNADAIFVGTDWEGTQKWNDIEAKLGELGKTVRYVGYTERISSTIIRKKMEEAK